jgi:hypothetical protein
MVEHRRQLGSGNFVGGERAPVEQEVVEVERLGLAFAVAVAAEDAPDLVDIGLAPRKLLR